MTKRSLITLENCIHSLIIPMKLLPILTLALLTFQSPVIGATILTPPVTSKPCKTVLLPNGDIACVPKLSQINRTSGDRLSELGTFSASSNAEASKVCATKGGNIAVRNQDGSYTCYFWEGLTR